MWIGARWCYTQTQRYQIHIYKGFNQSDEETRSEEETRLEEETRPSEERGDARLEWLLRAFMAISVLMRWQTSAYVISACMFSTSQTTSSASLFFWRSEQHLIFSTMRSVTDRKGSVSRKNCCFGRRSGPLFFLESCQDVIHRQMLMLTWREHPHQSIQEDRSDHH